jgi:ElaA protein
MIAVSVTDDLATCLALRRVVFIEEQGVPEAEEVDGRDGEAVHLLARRDSVPVGTARILIAGDTGKIGRVCVLPEARGIGAGTALVQAAVAHLRGVPGVVRARLGAQVHALGFYERLGFEATGPVYDDAGIPHRDMVLPLTPAR